jgi:hypothetical protein
MRRRGDEEMRRELVTTVKYAPPSHFTWQARNS